MASLYEITGEFLTLQDALEEADDAEYVQTLLDTMEGLEYEFELKADNYARIMRNLTSDTEGLKTEIARLNGRLKALDNNISALKNRLEDSMLQTGKTKFKTEFFSFGIQNNPPSVEIDAEFDKIPAEYLIQQEPKVNKKKLKEDLQSGKDLKGIAHLEQGKSLRIR